MEHGSVADCPSLFNLCFKCQMAKVFWKMLNWTVMLWLDPWISPGWISRLMLWWIKMLKMLTLPSASGTCSHQVLVPRSNNVSFAPSYSMYAMGDGWPSRYAEVIITKNQTMPRILVVYPFNIAYLWDLPCKRGYCRSFAHRKDNYKIIFVLFLFC